jgi:hypothetical protein
VMSAFMEGLGAALLVGAILFATLKMHGRI